MGIQGGVERHLHPRSTFVFAHNNRVLRIGFKVSRIIGTQYPLD